MQRDATRRRAKGSGCESPARFAMVLLAAVALFAVNQRAGALTTPLHIGAWQSIEDEFGQKLEGQAQVGGDLVQVLWASNGVIHPPAVDGTPHSENPLVAGGATHIGALSSPGLVNEGIFAASIANDRPGDGAEVFVRVFNAPTLAAASFYGDSDIFPVTGNNVFEVQIAGTTQPIDPNDNDNDGLNNSWEKSYESDPNNPDSDGDGMIDGHEVRAGTDLGDPFSLLIMVAMGGDGGSWQESEGTNVWTVTRYTDVTVQWPSVVGKRYRVQFTSDPLTEDPAYMDVSEIVTATETTTTVIVPDGLLLGEGTFRVRLVEE